MSLADLAALGSFVSGVAVLISLVYVSVQVRQARRHQQAAIRQGRADRIVNMCLELSDASVAEAIAKVGGGDDDVTETQLTQYGFTCRGFFYHCEEEYYQHKEGLANAAYYASFVAGTREHFTVPGIRVQWKLQRGAFVPEFAAFMDGLMAQTRPVSHTDVLAAWKAALAAENAGHD